MIKNKTIVTFGTGDIMMACTEMFPDHYMELHFSQVEPGEIGGQQRENHNEKYIDELDSDIIFRFNNIGSINALKMQLENAIEVLNKK